MHNALRALALGKKMSEDAAKGVKQRLDLSEEDRKLLDHYNWRWLHRQRDEADHAFGWNKDKREAHPCAAARMVASVDKAAGTY